MTFTSPLWLVGLLPWMAVTIWLFTGRHDHAQVPFLNLWKGPDTKPPRARAAIEVPPLPIICMILGMLLAIIGAARPQLMLARAADQVPQIPASQPSPSNFQIVTASVSILPKPQAMVRVRNDSDSAKASLKITSGGHETTVAIDLPPRGQERNYFVDLDSVDAMILIDLADNRAMLSLIHSPPLIESRGNLPQEVQRMIAAYTKLKPATAAAARIIVTPDALAPTQPAVILAPTDLSQNATVPRVADHPINAHVDWPVVLRQDIRISSTNPPGAGWQTILSVNDHPAVAVREFPARQVWIGFSFDAWPRSSEFVIFWTNVFDWIGQVENGAEYAFQAAGSVMPATSAPTKWQAQSEAPSTARDVTGVFLIGSVAIIFVAAMAWATCKNCASG